MQEQFDDYCIGPYMNPVDASMNTPTLCAASPAPKERDTVTEFRRGIKRNASIYPILKNEKGWDAYKQTTMAQANSQGISDVFNGSFVPTGTEATELFKEQQKFVFAIFDRTLQTNKGKLIVRGHIGSGDAQAVWKQLRAHQETSTGAQMNAAKWMVYITLARWGAHWNGTAQAFILHWMDQVCIHATLSDKNDHFSDNMKKTMLMNAFGPLKQLQRVQDEDMQHIARHERPLTYMEYAEILQAAAVSHDRQEKPQGATNQMKRSVYHSAINDVKDNYNDYNECSPYGIDSQLDTIQANAAEHCRYNPAASVDTPQQT